MPQEPLRSPRPTQSVLPRQHRRCALIRTYVNNSHNNRSNRHRHSHGITSRSHCSMGCEYYHHQRHPDSVRHLQLQHTTYRWLRHCQCNRNHYSFSYQYCRCSIIFTEPVYQYGTYTCHAHYHGSDRHWSTIQFTCRSHSLMGIQYDHHQRHTLRRGNL